MNEEQTIEAGAAGAPEGAFVEPTHEDVQSMYDELGIKASAPSGKSKGRPKTTDVRAEDDAKKGTGDSSARSAKNNDNTGNTKNAHTASGNGDAGDGSDAQGAKNGKDGGRVQGESEKTDSGVRKDESASKEDSERRGEEGTDDGDNRPGEEDGQPKDAPEEGKRPGKSNPAIERRIQQITEEKRAAEQRAAEAEQRLLEATRAQQQARINQEDPEYSIDDFRRVQDNQTGEIMELTPEQAELAWRRWKDGYDQRANERQARANHEAAMAERESEMTRQMMEHSVEAYDALAGLMDEYPELVSDSGQFDEDFAAEAMPIINESIEYAPGTEPGNQYGNAPVIIGLKIHPKRILSALKNINEKKRALPLNGLNDTVETRSNVAVPHSRSSDPNVNAANQLYKELGINKRI